jgi:DNA-binding transcriptional regulator YiaG
MQYSNDELNHFRYFSPSLSYPQMRCQKWPIISKVTPDQEHSFLRACSQEEACKYLADKVRRMRRQAKQSQQVFAQRAQIPLRTYKRFEAHGRGSLQTFIQVLRATERAQYLFMLFPSPGPTIIRPTFEERLRRLTPTKFKTERPGPN